MIKRILLNLKPGVPRQIHLLLAATLWSVIGGMLMFRGISFLAASEKLWIIIPALIVGTIKSLFILDKTARKGVRRILEMADGTCLGAVYSIQTWLLVLAMMGTGMALRHSTFPRDILGGLYMTIGWALFFSSRHAWLARKRISDLRDEP
jgi:hypothetical protein